MKEILDIPFDELSDEKKVFVNYYYKHLPVIDTDCVMNKICKYIENVDFEIKSKIRSSQDFDYKVLQTSNFIINKKLYEEIKQEVERTFTEWSEKRKEENRKSNVRKNSVRADEKSKFDKEVECSILKNNLLQICSNEEKLTNHLVYYFYCDKLSSNKNTLWSLVGKQLYENVKQNTKSFYFPVKNNSGNLRFLYENYSIERIELEEDDLID